MEPVTIWMWSLAAGGLVIVVVALLLLAIIATARSILTGSSWNRSVGSPMHRMTRALRSSSPPVKSIIESDPMS